MVSGTLGCSLCFLIWANVCCKHGHLVYFCSTFFVLVFFESNVFSLLLELNCLSSAV